MTAAKRVELAELQIADPSGRWEALGFAVAGSQLHLGGVILRLGAQGRGVTRWGLRGIAPTDAIDGLLTTVATGPAAGPETSHPNGAVGLDHVVVLTPDFDRTSTVLENAGMPLRRIRDAGGFRQGFRRLGPAILELVEVRDEDREAPARFWGLVILVSDLQALAERLGDRLGDIRPAVQPGRQIATLQASAGLTPAVAFMDPADP